jgi:hypothetical protein
MKRRLSSSLARPLLPLLALAVLCGAARPARAALDRNKRVQIMKGVVLIVAMEKRDGKLVPVSRGSGSIISSNGLILTNNHVITDPQTGALRDVVAVGLTTAFDQTPRPTCLASPARAIRRVDLDLAVIKCEAEVNGQPLRRAIAWTTVEVGDGSKIVPGDDLSIVGYPAIGGTTITFSAGKVGGFLDDEKLGARSWIKTDALISPGVSGGAAFDDEGKLVGVPTQLRWQQGGRTNIGLVRPVDKGKALIALATSKPWQSLPRAAASQPTPTTMPTTPATPPDPATPTPATPTPTPVPNPEADPEPEPTPQPTPTTSGRSSHVGGQLVDAATLRPVSGAVVLFLKPGVRVNTLRRETLSKQVFTAAVSSSQGTFRSTLALPQGASYGLVVMAKGFRTVGIDGGAQMMLGTPPLLNLGVLRLQRATY